MMMQLVVSRVALVRVCAASRPCRASYSAVTSSSWAAKNGSSPVSPSEEICSVTCPVRVKVSGPSTRQPSRVPSTSWGSASSNSGPTSITSVSFSPSRDSSEPPRIPSAVSLRSTITRSPTGLVGLEEGHADQRLGEVAAEQLAVGGDPVEQHRVALDGDAERQHQQRGAGEVALRQRAAGQLADPVGADRVRERTAAVQRLRGHEDAEEGQLAAGHPQVEAERRPGQEQHRREGEGGALARHEGEHAGRHQQRALQQELEATARPAVLGDQRERHQQDDRGQVSGERRGERGAQRVQGDGPRRRARRRPRRGRRSARRRRAAARSAPGRAGPGVASRRGSAPGRRRTPTASRSPRASRLSWTDRPPNWSAAKKATASATTSTGHRSDGTEHEREDREPRRGPEGDDRGAVRRQAHRDGTGQRRPRRAGRRTAPSRGVDRRAESPQQSRVPRLSRAGTSRNPSA